MIRPGVLRRYWQAGRTVFADYGGPLLAATVLEADVIRCQCAMARRVAAP